MKKKAVIVDFSKSVTGAYKSSCYVKRCLQEDYYEVTHVLPKESEIGLSEERGDFLQKMILPRIRKSLSGTVFFPILLLFSSIRISLLLKKKRADLLILNDYDNFYSLALRLCGWRGKTVTFVRRVPSSQSPNFLTKLWINSSISTSNHVVAVSNAVLRELPESNKVSFIYNCIDIPSSSVYDLDVCSGKVVFLYLANYMPGKGQLDALKAFEIACRSVENIELRFYGGDLGLKKNTDFKINLMQIAKAKGLSDKIYFYGFCESAYKEINCAHVLLNFSYSESFSRTCVEAAACSRPVVATKCGGPEEIVVDSKTGFLVDVSDILGMADKLVWFAENSDRIPVMGAAAKSFCKERFSYEKFRMDFLALLETRSV